ncbi:secreted PhoX family phosphatase [Bacillus pakistanensis]|uniref:Secreted PhoX family phosphatase n=1 Tax=Rossellomorea pakistanensis TaxID=992288 RepID=A0ABS2NIQ8_9BACI|nr:alkaline phosphatase PhoX [Bacillus pakistanensis]MBM7587659.1 secreted PhoX family phosphatase [Bacillus pakistanensis]
MDRRLFLTYVGSGTAALVAASTGLGVLSDTADAKKHGKGHGKGGGKPLTTPFKPIDRTWENDLVLSKGYRYNIVASYGDQINSKGEIFGDAADLTVYFPIDSLEGGTDSEEGLIWVNHEFPEPGNYMEILGINESYDTVKEKLSQSKYPELLEMEKVAVGGSVIRVKKENGEWKMVQDDTYNRRVDGKTPIQLTGPARGSKSVKGATTVEGSLGNCSGGRTLWDTALSCEENTEYGDDYGWPNFTDEHYGWVVEVDPFDASKPVRKHTALGRFAHENAAMGLTKDGKVVVYMGDDSRDECFYKFVSEKKFNKKNRNANFDLLEKGTLYVANLGKQEWIALDYAANPALQKEFDDQADVLTNARKAAKIVGGTRLDRPEDVEIHPEDGSVFLSLTNNSDHGNFHGQIIRFVPENDDHGSDSFTFEVFVAGGQQSGITCPDNLHFDSKGNLWVVEDFAATEDNMYAAYKNCGVFMIPTDGKEYGIPHQFASGPQGSEVTGPWLTPDEKTLFLDVQHPSTWNPYPGQKFGRSCLVAIQGGRFK